MFSWDDYSKYRISPSNSSSLRHTDIVQQLTAFQTDWPEQCKLAPLGESVQGRTISKLTLGSGPTKVLAWSQMHGNEPTHTAALIDLIHFLLTAPELPTAKAILNECELHFILMLNPDGAERWTRRNAQDIDINRDALLLQSPEGRILRTAVESIQPAFALNLHNQRPRTTVDDGKQQVAAFSLLAPPIDAEDRAAENVITAKRLASFIAEAVVPYCPGEVSRYNADFMPRCFGEWVQQQGAATLTFEAGGWSTVDTTPLVQLHFHGLVTCLEAIATDCFRSTTPDIYENLPRTGEHDLFDILLQRVTVFNGPSPTPYSTDLGINFKQTDPTTADGTIVDLGDLSIVSTGKTLVAEDDLICVPGRIIWRPEISPQQLPTAETIQTLLAAGVTTLLGHIDLDSDEDLAAFAELSSKFSLPVNLGFLAKLTEWSPASQERLFKAIANGALGILAEGLPAEAQRILNIFRLPVITESTLPTIAAEPISLADCAAQAHECAQILDLKSRGIIRLEAIADLALFQAPPTSHSTTPTTANALHQLLVGGNVVFNHGQVTDSAAGVLLKKASP